MFTQNDSTAKNKTNRLRRKLMRNKQTQNPETNSDECEEKEECKQIAAKKQKSEIIFKNEIYKTKAATEYFKLKNKTNFNRINLHKFTEHETEINESIVNKPFSLASESYVEQPERKMPMPPFEFSGPGVIKYNLSNSQFIERGWTNLPIQKIFRKMVIYRMHEVPTNFDWFSTHKDQTVFYDTGEVLANSDATGRGKWYYKNGQVALVFYDAEELNVKQRVVVYSNGEFDNPGGRHRPTTVLASFDYLGNGIVFDHAGNIRLKYNQTEGVILDKNIGPYSHWKWHDLNDPPIFESVFVENKMKTDEAIKNLGLKYSALDPERHEGWVDEDVLEKQFSELENDEIAKMAGKRYIPFRIKFKAFKINNNFSLRITDQSHIRLTFFHGRASLKLNLGLELDSTEILDYEFFEVDEVAHTYNSMELNPTTASLEFLQKEIRNAKDFEKRLKSRAEKMGMSQTQNSTSRLLTRGAPALPP